MTPEKLFDFLENSYHKEYEQSLTLDRLSLSLMQVLALLGAAQFYLFTSYDFSRHLCLNVFFIISVASALGFLVTSGVFLAKSYAGNFQYRHIDYKKMRDLLENYEEKKMGDEMRGMCQDCLEENQSVNIKKRKSLFYAKKFMVGSAAFLLIEAIFFVIAAKI